LIDDLEGNIRNIYSFLNVKVNKKIISKAAGKSKFSNFSSGRKNGVEDKNSFYRKGVVGDWKNYMNKENVELFKKYSGESLILLGYEKDDNW
jgi:hypothetical protein